MLRTVEKTTFKKIEARLPLQTTCHFEQGMVSHRKKRTAVTAPCSRSSDTEKYLKKRELKWKSEFPHRKTRNKGRSSKDSSIPRQYTCPTIVNLNFVTFFNNQDGWKNPKARNRINGFFPQKVRNKKMEAVKRAKTPEIRLLYLPKVKST